jgi:hypothetical protein
MFRIQFGALFAQLELEDIVATYDTEDLSC